MFVRALLGLAVALAVVSGAGCSSLGTAPARFPVETIPVPEEATSYLTEARPDGALGGPGLARVQANLVAALEERGYRARPDGALAATASWALREVHRQHPVGGTSADAASRHFGFAGVVSSVFAFGTQNPDFLRAELERLPGNLPITAYGLSVSPSGQSAAVVIGSVELSYAPIPRSFEPGQSATLKGQVAPRFASAHLFLTKPNGTVDDLPQRGRDFDAVFQLSAPGSYRLEVMGDGKSGPEILSNVPLYVGVATPPITGTGGAVVDPEQAEARMLLLLNEARRAAGLGTLLPDAELREIALGHSSDMADHHFFAHVSPTTGGPGDRLQRAGTLVSLFGENVALASTPEEAHEGLMNSPGHRANMLKRDFTHVGIAARKADAGIVVTLNFGRRPRPDAIPTSAGQVESAILALRAAKGLPVATADAIYRVAAQAGAEALASGADLADANKALSDAEQREVNRLRATRPATCVVSGELLELSNLETMPPVVSQPGLRRFGVGARTRRDAKGTRLSIMIIIEGVPCQ